MSEREKGILGHLQCAAREITEGTHSSLLKYSFCYKTVSAEMAQCFSTVLINMLLSGMTS